MPFVTLQVQLAGDAVEDNRQAERMAEELAEELSWSKGVYTVAIEDCPLPEYKDGEVRQ